MKPKNESNARRTIWAQDALWAEVEAAAKQDDRTVSSWIRAALTATLEAERKWRKDPLFTVEG